MVEKQASIKCMVDPLFGQSTVRTKGSSMGLPFNPCLVCEWTSSDI